MENQPKSAGKNQDDFAELSNASERIRVDYNKVSGHSGVAGNEAADRLANAGMKRARQ